MILKLVLKEIRFRKLSFILSLSAISFAVAFFVFFITSNAASERETVRLTRDMGFNLRIIPKETKMSEFWTTGFSKYTMPQNYVDRFWKFRDFPYAHLTATLHKAIMWHDKEVILTGIAPEIDPAGRANMALIIKPGEVFLGYEVARESDARPGDEIEILQAKFHVVKILPESGSNDDIRIYGTLAEFQKILGLEGQINEIMALNCLCLSPDQGDPLAVLRDRLEEVLPESRVIMNTTIANAREKQRFMLEEYFGLISIFVVVLLGIWIGSLTMINTNVRQSEIGILQAIGYRNTTIFGIFIGRAAVIGIVSAIIGFVLGSFLALKFGNTIFKITASSIKPMYSLLAWSFLLAPVFSAISSFIPATIASLKDPAAIIKN